MSINDDNIKATFEFQVTGNPVKDIQGLLEVLSRVETVAVASAESLEKFNQRAKATALRGAISELKAYAQALKDVGNAARKVPEHQDRLKLDPSYQKARDTLPVQDSGAWKGELQRRISVENGILAQQQKRQKALSDLAVAQANEQWREQQKVIQAQKDQANAAIRAQEQYYNSLANTRYALHDVSRTATIAAAALTAVFAVPIAKFASYQQEFASVARTVQLLDEDVDALRDSFVDLTTDIPSSFSGLAQIGTLAGQLDIGAESVANFTEIVAKFAATTNVTAQTAAEEIGRTAQLTQTSAAEYENLASAIYQVGVTSVATESEILAMMSSIATAGNLAGLSNTQIVALAGSLSSLGIQPEAARGSLQRLFNLIENGAKSSTDATARLVQLTGMGSEELQRLWKDGMGGSQVVFSAFIRGLGAIQDAGENTTNILREMGVYQVRDQRLLQVLSNNTEVYAKALNEANTAYANGNALSEGYAKQTDNLANNFQRLLNTMGGILSEIGEGPGTVLNELIKLLTGVGQALLNISRNPLARVFTTAAIAVAALFAGIAGYIAIASRMQASVFAMQQAFHGLSNAHVSTSFSLWNLSRELFKASLAFKSGVTSGGQFNATLHQTTVAAEEAAVGLASTTGMSNAMGVSFKVSAALGSVLRATLIGIGKAGVIMAALSLAIWAVDEALAAFSSDAEKAERFWGAFDSTGLVEAIKADTEAAKDGAKVYREITIEQGKADDQGRKWSTTLQDLAGMQATTGDEISRTTSAIEDQTLALGKNVVAQMAKDFAAKPEIVESWRQNGLVLEQVGFSLKKYYELLAEGGGKAKAYVEDMRAQLERLRVTENLNQNSGYMYADLVNAQEAMTTFGQAADTYEIQIQNATTSSEIFAVALEAMGIATEEATDSITIAGKEYANFSAYLKDSLDGVQNISDLNDAFRDLGQSLLDNGQAFDQFSEAGSENLSAVMDAVKQLQEMTGDDQTAFGANLLGFMAALQQQGVETGGELSFLGQMLNDTLGGTYNLDFNSEAAQQSILAVIDQAITMQNALVAAHATAMRLAGEAGNMRGYQTAQIDYNASTAKLAALEGIRETALQASLRAQDGMNSAVDKGTKANKKNASSTKKAARSIRDWVSDLRSVMGVADEFRWGVDDAWAAVVQAQQEAVTTMLETTYDMQAALDRATRAQQFSDDVQTMFYDVQEQAERAQEAVEDAMESIDSAYAKLQSLSSERTQLEYGLNVAVMYGDLLRAEEIRARLAELDVEEAKTQRDLAKAHEELTDAIESQNKTLVGNSQQAIKNRKIVRSLAGEYIDWINELIDGGASQQEVSDALQQSREDFMAQAQAMGFNVTELGAYISVFARSTETTKDGADAVRDLYDAWQEYILQLIQSGASQSKINAAIKAGRTEVANLGREMGLAPAQVKKYVDAFDGISKIVDKIPKDLTVKFSADMDPADKAIKEWRAKNTGGKGASSPINVPITTTLKGPSAYQAEKDRLFALYKGYASEYMKNGSDRARSNMQYYYDKWKKYYVGGFTGKGNKYEPAGVVHRGEYVVRKEDVNQNTGKPYFMEKTYNNTSSVAFPSVLMVELSPTDRAILAEGNGPVTLEIDGREVARTVNKVNRTATIRGTN